MQNILWKDKNIARYLAACVWVLLLVVADYFLITYYSKDFGNVAVFYFSLWTVILMIMQYNLLNLDIKSTLLVIFSPFIVPFTVYYIFPNYLVHSAYGILAIIVINGSIVFAIYENLRIRISYVTTEGILIGNAYPNNNQDIILKRKPEFIGWSKILQIKVKERQKRTGKMINIIYFLEVKTNSTIRSCQIKDYIGLEKILTQLGKLKLLVKDFKYSKIMNSSDDVDLISEQISKIEENEPILD